MPATTPRRRARPRADRESDTEARILSAAERVFVRAGTSGARMQAIAREARVNSALLHYYFRSKKKLAEAVFVRAAGTLMPAILGVLGSDLPLADKIDRVITAEIDQLSQTPFLPAYLLSEMAHHPDRLRQLLSSIAGQRMEAAGRHVAATIARQIRAEVRAGAMKDIPAEQFIVSLLSLCVFPFAARPMLGVMLGLDGPAFDAFIAQRRRDLPIFFKAALRP